MKKIYAPFVLVLLCTTLIFAQSQTSLLAYSKKDTIIDGQSYKMKINKKTGAIHRIYGLKNFAEPNTNINEQNIRELNARFLNKNCALFKISPGDLKLLKAQRKQNKWLISYRQLYKNVPVHRSYFDYTLNEKGDILLFGSDIYPNISINVNANLSDTEALEVAIKRFHDLSGCENQKVIKKPELKILPVDKDGKYSYFLVYHIELEMIDSTHVSSQAYFIDAHNGQIISECSNIGNAQIFGTVDLKYFPDHHYDTPISYGNWGNGAVTLSYYYILGQRVDVYRETSTSSSGYYSFEENLPDQYYNLEINSNIANSSLTNSYVNIISMDQPYQAAISPGEHNWSWACDESNLFYHINWVHNFYKNHPFNYNGMDYPMPVYIHCGSGTNGGGEWC